MIIGKKIRLKPTKEQEMLFWKSAGVARWSYNYFIATQNETYQSYLDNNKTGKRFIGDGEVRKYINNVLKPTTHAWLKEVGSNVMKQGVKDAKDAYTKYFKKLADKPKFKSKHKSTPSFYVNYESLKRIDGFHFRGEKIGIVETSEMLPKVKDKYSNPHIKYDGKHWCLSFSIEIEEETYQLTNISLGIDVGIKDLAICSNGETYKNINKGKEVKRLEKKLKRELKSFSRMRENNMINKIYYKSEDKKGILKSFEYIRPLRECKNYQKQLKAVQGIYRRLTNIRNNHLHQTSSGIVKTKPFRIVMETLNIKGIMKNKHLSKAIQQQKLYEFKRQIQYKCKKYGIEFIEVDKFFPSSKKCSCCENIKKDLKLSDRIYKCDNCGISIDRDYNASINLANYSV
ncbi:RNA-guided endonuclease InsQ/TnpB family protein [Clostridioides sp. GD02377]|uniref:RNA-guided endonuclease InsQ/TnpB family protein n=1 Tax=unclassified Clostridioides TaxID=2635829 RepID=UPI0038AEB9C8